MRNNSANLQLVLAQLLKTSTLKYFVQALTCLDTHRSRHSMMPWTDSTIRRNCLLCDPHPFELIRKPVRRKPDHIVESKSEHKPDTPRSDRTEGASPSGPGAAGSD